MSDTPTIKRKATITDIARVARVGTATVDRVLHDRPNVSEITRQRVLQARTSIETGSLAATHTRPWRLQVFLPADAGPSTEYLGQCFREIGAEGAAIVELQLSVKMEPAVLARKLRACARRGIDAVAFQALDDQLVRDAVSSLAGWNIPALAMISGLDNSDVLGFIGMNNRLAGRAAGYMMGRLVAQPGPVAVVTGGHLYQVHEDREIGFRSLVRREYMHLNVVTCTGNDDIIGNFETMRDFLRRHPALVGIYNVGGGNEGIVRALTLEGIADEIVFIGHNLTPKTRTYLLDGSMDIIMHQNMRMAARYTTDALIARLENRPFDLPVLPTEIITRENIPGMDHG